MFFQLVEDKKGKYIHKNKRYTINSCQITESLEQYIDSYDEEDNPIYKTRIVLNKGWDEFNTLEEAERFYFKEDEELL